MQLYIVFDWLRYYNRIAMNLGHFEVNTLSLTFPFGILVRKNQKLYPLHFRPCHCRLGRSNLNLFELPAALSGQDEQLEGMTRTPAPLFCFPKSEA
ncbi:hypothetical protein [Octadecabacter algicola]|uniref:hypothetical protein n=1 Tax=Octadecabacter algicola TaxID=2909342 RepID=UPI003AB97402